MAFLKSVEQESLPLTTAGPFGELDRRKLKQRFVGGKWQARESLYPVELFYLILVYRFDVKIRRISTPYNMAVAIGGKRVRPRSRATIETKDVGFN